MCKSKDTQEIEKLKIKYGFLKFLLGTFAISLLSLVINWQIQEKKLQFEIQTKESDYIAQFLKHGLDKELENRRDFAAYFVRLSPSEEARGRWKRYLDFVEDLIGKARDAERIISEKDTALKIAAEKVVLAQQQAEAARAKLIALSADKSGGKDTEQLEKQLSQSSKEAEQLRTQLQQIQENLVNTRQDLASIRSKPIDLESNYPISADNVAKKSKIKNDYWDWTLFVKAPEDVLEQIAYVEYTLHPTFPNPVRIVNQRGSGPYAFPLTTSGWGTFTVKVKVYYKDGTYQRLSHSLRF
jgi:pYEATS domain-containing protein involved in immunity